jgi:hypothetical protein
MTSETAAPHTRRAVILGAFGGLLATAGALVRAPQADAGTDGDLTLGTTNNAVAPTELSAPLVAPALRVVGNGIGVQAVGQTALEALGGNIAVSAIADGNPLSPGSPGIGIIGWSRTNNGVGVLGWSTNGSTSTPPYPPKTGVFGISTVDAVSTGVVGRSTAGQGVRGEGTSGIGVRGEATAGVGMQAAATTGTALSASADGPAVSATSSAADGIRGRGQLDGVIGESAGGRAGVVGYSGAGAAPAGPLNTGVYGEATTDATARGVTGKSTAGQGVRGEATSGIGVQGAATTGIGLQAAATTGVALAVSGRATFNRSGRATIPVNQSYVDQYVPGGLGANANVLALLQALRSGVYVAAVRTNFPAPGKVRIYLNKVASTTVTTPVAWFVLG